jgi:hypothetical protein
MLDSVPRRRRRSRMVLQRQSEEEEFTAQFERECAFMGCCLTVETPSNSWCIDRVEEVPQIESVVSHGTQTQFSRTPYSRVTGPPRTTSVSELLSRQTVGAEASEHQRLMRVSRAPERFDSHLAMETSRSVSDSTSSGSHLVRDQGEDLGEMPRLLVRCQE